MFFYFERIGLDPLVKSTKKYFAERKDVLTKFDFLTIILYNVVVTISLNKGNTNEIKKRKKENG